MGVPQSVDNEGTSANRAAAEFDAHAALSSVHEQDGLLELKVGIGFPFTEDFKGVA